MNSIIEFRRCMSKSILPKSISFYISYALRLQVKLLRESLLSTVSISTVPSLVRFRNKGESVLLICLFSMFFLIFCWDISLFATFHNSSISDYRKSLRNCDKLCNKYFYKLDCLQFCQDVTIWDKYLKRHFRINLIITLKDILE